jgi:hypothetical protein
MLSQALLLNLANEYVEEVRTQAKVTSKDIVEPVLLPDKGIWHPVADKVRTLCMQPLPTILVYYSILL